MSQAKYDLYPPTTGEPRAQARIGHRLPRIEDERFLRGGGRYVTDLIATSRALRVKVLRSPHAHARIIAVDTSKARTMAGVVLFALVDRVQHAAEWRV